MNSDNKVNKKEMETFLILLNPVAPHITEELWTVYELPGYLHQAAWPQFDPEKAKENTINLPVQVNGKMRGTVEVPADVDKETAIAAAKEEENIARHLKEKYCQRNFVP